MGLDPVFHSVRQELEGGDETVLGPGPGGPTWGSLAGVAGPGLRGTHVGVAGRARGRPPSGLLPPSQATRRGP